MLPKIEAVAFDLDGTLIDSAPDIRHALNTALKKAGLERYDLDRVRTWIGDGPDALIVRALEAQEADTRDAALHQRLRRDFDVATLAAPLAFGTVYEGIHELVVGLRHAMPLVVVSNKPTPLSRAVLDAAQLLPFVQAVFGADTAALRKPAPGLLIAAATGLGVAPANLLMVGDAPPDRGAARAAGCPFALADWGYGAASVGDVDPAWRLTHPSQLLERLMRAQNIT